MRLPSVFMALASQSQESTKINYAAELGEERIVTCLSKVNETLRNLRHKG